MQLFPLKLKLSDTHKLTLYFRSDNEQDLVRSTIPTKPIPFNGYKKIEQLGNHTIKARCEPTGEEFVLKQLDPAAFCS